MENVATSDPHASLATELTGVADATELILPCVKEGRLLHCGSCLCRLKSLLLQFSLAVAVEAGQAVRFAGNALAKVTA